MQNKNVFTTGLKAMQKWSFISFGREFHNWEGGLLLGRQGCLVFQPAGLVLLVRCITRGKKKKLIKVPIIRIVLEGIHSF